MESINLSSSGNNDDNITRKLANLRFRLAKLQGLRAESQTQNVQMLQQRVAATSEQQRQLETALKLLAQQLQRLVGYATIAFYFPSNKSWSFLKEENDSINKDRKKLYQFFSIFESSLDVVENVTEPIVINDMFQFLIEQHLEHRISDELLDLVGMYARSWMCVPLTAKDQPLVWVSITHDQANYFTQRHLVFVKHTFSQLISAYSRLYSRAQAEAVQLERQRMARELHDSVTQVFYGIELAANTANALLKRNEPERVTSQLNEILQLAEAGLAEMRALLLELRPESLASEGLVMALFKQIAALQMRHNLTISTNFSEEPNIDIEAKEVFYRIAQEALQNIVKHAQATAVQVCLNHDAASISLTVSDNGRGFDLKIPNAGHFGLISIQERAASIGASLDIQSKPGFGTQVIVHLTRKN